MVINKASTYTTQTILMFILFLISATMFLPFVYILCVSFTDGSVFNVNALNFWPRKWSLEAYRFVFSGGGFINSLKSSIFITVIGTPLSIMVNAGMAYMLAQKKLPGRSIMLKLVVFTMLFSPGMISNYLVVRELGLIDKLWALILPNLAVAWTILVMKSFFQSIPEELGEAARIDGANDVRTFFTIILPLSKAMLAAFTLFTCVVYWNTYFSAIMYINTASKWPLQVFLQQVVMSATSSEFLDPSLQTGEQVLLPQEVIKMATVIIAVGPILLVYPFLQKHFAKGVLVGSVKG